MGDLEIRHGMNSPPPWVMGQGYDRGEQETLQASAGLGEDSGRQKDGGQGRGHEPWGMKP